MRFTDYSMNELTEISIGCAIEVHRALGPGLMESAYQECLLHELTTKSLNVEVEKQMPIVYKDLEINQRYRIDLLVKDTLVLELKTVEKFSPVHLAQILTYLILGNYPVGLLINFNVELLKNGIKRVRL
jgi:GxxExxY protein